jgi:hypothetical protein
VVHKGARPFNTELAGDRDEEPQVFLGQYRQFGANASEDRAA